MEADYALEEKNTGEYRVYLQPPEYQKDDTDCDDEEEDEIALPVNGDILPLGVLLAPAEVGTRATKTPRIIDMRGISEDKEYNNSLSRREDKKKSEEESL